MSQPHAHCISGIVLAGAYPRGQSLFDRLRPRPLLPVAQMPLVAFPLRWLAEGGIRSATVCSNSAGRAVRDALTGDPTLPLEISFHEDWMPRGAAGCVRDAAIETSDTTFIIVDGTTIPRVDIAGLLETHEVCKAALTVAVHHDPGQQKSASTLSPTGIYVFDRRILDFIPRKGFQDIKEGLVPRLHAAGERIVTHMGYGACPRIFDPATYLSVNHWMTSRVVSSRRATAGYTLVEQALVHDSISLGRGARLVGPMVIGPGAVVAHDATLVGPLAIGANCYVGEKTLLSRTVLWDNCWVGAGVSLDRCVVADGAVVRPGVSLQSALKSGPSQPDHSLAMGADLGAAWTEPVPAAPPRWTGVGTGA